MKSRSFFNFKWEIGRIRSSSAYVRSDHKRVAVAPWLHGDSLDLLSPTWVEPSWSEFWQNTSRLYGPDALKKSPIQGNSLRRQHFESYSAQLVPKTDQKTKWFVGVWGWRTYFSWYDQMKSKYPDRIPEQPRFRQSYSFITHSSLGSTRSFPFLHH